MKRIPDVEFLPDAYRLLSLSTGREYAFYILGDEDFYDEIKTNVEETSAWHDEGYYTDDDIRLAIGRCIMHRLNLEY